MNWRRAIWVLIALTCIALAAPAYAADEESADEIIDKALDKNALGFKSGQADVALIIEDKAGSRRVRKLDVKSKKIGDATRTLIELTHPTEVKGQAFLFAENTDGEDDVWMFVPAFSVTRRIEGSQKSGSFLGSHFTYADLESRDLEDADYKKREDAKIGKHAVYVIEATPEKGSDSEYGKIVTYVRKSDYMPLKIRYFDKSGKKEETLFVEKLDETDGGDTYIERMTLRPKTGGFTTIKIESFDPGKELADSLFSKDQLGK